MNESDAKCAEMVRPEALCGAICNSNGDKWAAVGFWRLIGAMDGKYAQETEKTDRLVARSSFQRVWLLCGRSSLRMVVWVHRT